MNIENENINSVPCVYNIEKGDNEELCVSEKTTLEVAEEDASDKKLICSSKKISKSRKYLLEIKDELSKSNGLYADLCSMIFGISLSLLLSLWASINIYSKFGFWIYISLTLVTVISFFMWIFFRKLKKNTADQKIDFILNDLLPNSEKTMSIMERK